MEKYRYHSTLLGIALFLYIFSSIAHAQIGIWPKDGGGKVAQDEPRAADNAAGVVNSARDGQKITAFAARKKRARIFENALADGANPTPDVKANGSDGQIVIAADAPLEITIALDAGDHVGEGAAWWILESTPAESFYYYDLQQGGMVEGLAPTHQGGLQTLPDVPLPNLTAPSLGEHTYYFGVLVSETAASSLAGQLFYDSVRVEVISAETCVDSRDSYSDYDNYVPAGAINAVDSEYYVLSYSWAPGYCAGVSEESKKPGNRDFLQCGGDMEFGYILHGLWPQGAMDGSGGYPRACEGDREKVDRAVLEQFLCMTPSVWLLQHEYEFHGTCMHDESLEDPEQYFGKAYELHSMLTLPNEKLPFSRESIQWFVANNPHLTAGAIQYYEGAQEWQFCYDNNFNVMNCP